MIITKVAEWALQGGEGVMGWEGEKDVKVVLDKK